MNHPLSERILAFSRVALIVAICFVSICIAKLYLSQFAYPKSSGIPGLLARKKVDCLFVGSSLTRQSYDMKLIDERYRLNAYAATYNSLSPAMAYKILKYAFEEGGVRVGTVVMEAYPYKLLYSPTAIEDVRLFNAAPVQVKEEILDEIYRCEHDLKKMYDLVVLADNDYLINAPVTYKLIDKLSYNGGYLYKNVAGLSRFPRSSELLETGRVNRAQRQAYHDLVQLCRRHGARIVFIEPFVPAYVQQGRTYTAAKHEVRRAIEATGNTLYDNSLVRLNNNDPSLFGDDIHLSTKGRELWSREVMNLLGKKEVALLPAPALSRK
ncbi:hypothetical protein KP005_11205 [Geomonas nitrogeniifigens]|uniref:SGNH/GDSL hydrolase family protein n=1 Tax=Geomonas diazotrophica TaxID=2843197 RepID=A0ABX8JGZ2_9BACT|nr:hypothetical protein [Geomonas nitrogeniifigens]QWV95952.1 hypothetical protein KP005_11205 [Geomonas nitrogeniifigens]